jgi:hypothetical protein
LPYGSLPETEKCFSMPGVQVSKPQFPRDVACPLCGPDRHSPENRKRRVLRIWHREQWDDSTVAISADEAVAATACDTEAKTAREEAKDFLMDLLSEGPVLQKEIKKSAEGAGLAWRTVQRAKGSLGIKARRQDERWFWRLPKGANSEGKDATLKNGALGIVGALDASDDGKNAKDAKDAKFESGAFNDDFGALDQRDFQRSEGNGCDPASRKAQHTGA